MQSKGNVVRFSVSLPPPLVKEFDNLWKDMGYGNRSKAIHDAMRTFISEFKWAYKEEEHVAGAILILYYIDKPNLLEKITSIQHKFRDIIFSTMHVHLEENKCLEIVAVNGRVDEIKKLTLELTAKKGVKQIKVAVMAP